MNEILQKWPDILETFKHDFEIDKTSFDTWINPLKVLSLSNEILKLTIDLDEINSSMKELTFSMVNKRYLKLLETTVNKILGTDYTLCLVSDDQEGQTPSSPVINTVNSENKGNLNPNYVFEKFVVGSNNNLAHAACLAVSEAPAETFNPLFLHGDTGLGKTHLLQAIAHRIMDEYPSLKVIYVTSETFTNEIIDSIHSKQRKIVSDFKAKYRSADVLLIDDIQFLKGKDGTQEEFFHTFNDLYQNNKQIVITSDRPPKDLEELPDRLIGRFSEGLTCDIQIPSYETKMAILNQKIEDRNMSNIPTDVKDYIVNNIKSSIRELEGALTNISAFAQLSRKDITLDLAMDALKDFVTPEHKRRVTSESIIETVADHFNISTDDIKSSKRNIEIAYPRQIAMYLCRQMTQDSSKMQGSAFGKDYSTVLYGAKKITNDLLVDPKLRNTIDILIKKIDPS